MKIKVCGMKLNTAEVAELRPDYLGFIFWEASPRYFDGTIPSLPKGITKTGVFVDATINEILDKVQKYGLDAVQLHGSESPEFCKELRVKSGAARGKSSAARGKSSLSTSLEKSAVATSPSESNPRIIKVFSIKDRFDFSILEPYEEVCDYFLFDTKGELPGGNGYAFDWKVLKNYPSTKPFFLSGGIGPGEADSIKAFMQRPESKYCHAIDINSRFEMEPGLKYIEKLENFQKSMRC
ncbi:phosphoribosylanthranilate isomerase [Pricia sp. S334]|uniref:N-(5'-phosphoribosyl)anthranilate isomerase n=1 Tax=Pricia mediterranea TaxID=3076079 RepID=A0ABU3L273_9FLAO|nr:phosphoribosylanthranilate isomerase [Pricia sp. S334]MDT7827839.1 phosphoribosylanthranilate isomerase [Pricia sp. S334]